MPNIPITRPFLDGSELSRIEKVLKSGWITQGRIVEQFERLFSDFTGAGYSVAVSSCTAGLHISLMCLGIGPGDDVIVPSFTFVATANAVEQTGARVLLCDINLSTLNIDVSRIEEIITPATRAIIPVHLFGLPSEMGPIMEIAKQYDLKVIEDAACGFGARYNGIHVGIHGDIGCFSFHPRKAITTGEGGMITTNTASLDNMARSLRDHGAEITDLQRHEANRPYVMPEFPYSGLNYRMTDIQAAIGLSQLEIADTIHMKRTRYIDKYNKFMDTIPWLTKPVYDDSFVHGYQSYVCLFEPEKLTFGNVFKIGAMRNEFMAYLHEKGVSTRPGTHAVHSLKYYREKYDLSLEDYPNSWIADHCSIAFPLFPSMTDQEFDYITETILNYKL